MPKFFHFPIVCSPQQLRTHPVTACLVIAPGLKMRQPSPLLLPHPQRSASWSCHPRCRLSPTLRLFISRSWRCGPVCQPCLLYTWAQRWRIRRKGLYRMANPHILLHFQPCLKRPYHHPHLLLHLCPIMTP